MAKAPTISEILKEARAARPGFIISSTPTLEGYRIREYLEPVYVCVSGTTSNFSDIKANFSKMIGGGTTRDYELAYKAMVGLATKQAADYALSIGANAIIDLEPAITDVGGSSLLIVLHGMYALVEKLHDSVSLQAPREAQEGEPRVEEKEAVPVTAGPSQPDPHGQPGSATGLRDTSEQQPPVKAPEAAQSSYKASGPKSVKDQASENGQRVTIGRDASGKVRFTPVRKQ